MIGVQLFGPSCALPTGGQGATLQGSHWSDTIPKLGLLLHVSAVSPMPVAKFQTWHLAFLLMPSCEPMVPKVPKKFKPPQKRTTRPKLFLPSCALATGGQRTTLGFCCVWGPKSPRPAKTHKDSESDFDPKDSKTPKLCVAHRWPTHNSPKKV